MTKKKINSPLSSSIHEVNARASQAMDKLEEGAAHTSPELCQRIIQGVLKAEQERERAH